MITYGAGRKRRVGGQTMKKLIKRLSMQSGDGPGGSEKDLFIPPSPTERPEVGDKNRMM